MAAARVIVIVVLSLALSALASTLVGLIVHGPALIAFYYSSQASVLSDRLLWSALAQPAVLTVAYGTLAVLVASLLAKAAGDARRPVANRVRRADLRRSQAVPLNELTPRRSGGRRAA
jgi:hypothetical protein